MRIAGTNIPENKRVVIALTYIFGIGKTKSEEILAETKVSPDKRVKDLTEDEQNAIRELAEKNRIEEDLRREISSNIKRLKDIKAYRGSRHARRLPTRGQRTKTNSRTLRGNVRVTMGSGKRKLEKT
ncbi:MAG: 30S ribosomal protein S13 [Parcubacteria group bacterium GW2011_GWB2_40_8]|nr:MAG: 30S ribosomal protein S13 [Parcubacteria group bacterium GW2011_GWF2_40_10]KKR46790.1 MAG: 30S ribosomal protein S13 [Parcubacteria group bacterium GW2011_GWA2_40_143]KKR59694.1 MAG: 30S ribosomal protein S13 [Parcubacteria group bacterium GW2011_GWC2_40_31]KKR74587.1 MAG: 30S ribosomal protein S13 [Parcubacteria group bacterium GW2011_GWB2_40_8]KKR75813.1 MAG: 30S ribosomal protein S13 [Parcubacteria group bacterium GW2011_GWE2_40_8]KKR80703.1 MAG: 30S ribosomal protein S13 [Parcubact